MRVALVVPDDIEGTSGGFYYDRRLRDRLSAHGHDVRVVSLRPPSYPRQLIDNLRPGRIASRLDDADVVVEDGLAHPSLVAANRRVSAPTVALLHMVATTAREGVRRRIVRRTERRFLRGVDAAIHNSEATRRAAERLGAPERSAVVLPAGDRFDATSVDAETVRKRARETPLQVTFLGNVVPRKGADTLVRGVARSDADWRLTIIGDRDLAPEYADRVRETAANAGVTDRVEFTGRLPDEMVAERLRDTHVLGLPSSYEPFGMATLEAMAFGCVPLASTVGGAAEYVEDGGNGLLIPPDDPDAVTGALDTLADRSLLAELGTAALARHAAWPGWRETMDDAVNFLETLVADPRRLPTAEATP